MEIVSKKVRLWKMVAHSLHLPLVPIIRLCPVLDHELLYAKVNSPIENCSLPLRIGRSPSRRSGINYSKGPTSLLTITIVINSSL